MNYLIDKMMFSIDNRTCLKLTTLLKVYFMNVQNVTCQLHNEASSPGCSPSLLPCFHGFQIFIMCPISIPMLDICKHNRFSWVACPHPSGCLHAAFNPVTLVSTISTRTGLAEHHHLHPVHDTTGHKLHERTGYVW
jgi:hypothetical protein